MCRRLRKSWRRSQCCSGRAWPTPHQLSPERLSPSQRYKHICFPGKDTLYPHASFSSTLCPSVNASHDLSSVKPLLTCSQVEGDEETIDDSESSCRGEDITINLQPTNAHEFGQALNAACCGGNTAACANLLASTDPDKLPQYLSTQLDGHTVSFIVQALDSHLLEKNPSLVYQHLNYLHTTDRFSVSILFWSLLLVLNIVLTLFPAAEVLVVIGLLSCRSC